MGIDEVKIQSMEDYRDVIMWLFEHGCEPNVAKRGKDVVRFHVTRAGNFWEDGSLFEACETAVNNWIRAGMPEEGS